MRVALFNTMQSFVRGGAEILVDDLYEQLVKRGHDAVLFRIPFPSDYQNSMLETVFVAENLNFNDYDVLIAFKFPAYCALHRHKNMWMFHQFRQVYELFGQEYGILDNDMGKAIKNIITEIDNHTISNSNIVYTIAEESTGRLKKYNGIDSIVLNQPLTNYENYYCGKTGDYIYYPSRVTNMKRQHLVVDAMKFTKSDVKLIIDGVCTGEPEYLEGMRKTIKDNKLESKIDFTNSWVTDEDKINKIANCLGVIYIPYKEDSCGLVTMEGFYSSKPVISCTDSGGTTEFICDESTGLFAEPTPQSIAKCMDKLFFDKKLAIKMGKEANKWIINKNLNWDETVRRLLS